MRILANGRTGFSGSLVVNRLMENKGRAPRKVAGNTLVTPDLSIFVVD